MIEDLLPLLRGRYPEIFFSEHVREIACYPGWLELLDGLCQSIANHLGENPDVPVVVVRQIKEKFGGLRFYYQGGDEWCRAAVDEAQEASLSICEVCGRQGRLVGARWVSVRCDEHTVWMPGEGTREPAG
jgi:hypothetical protein